MPKHVAVKGIGFLMKKEVEALSPLLKEPKKPFAVILVGAKVKGKIGLIQGMPGDQVCTRKNGLNPDYCDDSFAGGPASPFAIK